MYKKDFLSSEKELRRVSKNVKYDKCQVSHFIKKWNDKIYLRSDDFFHLENYASSIICGLLTLSISPSSL